MNHSAAQQPVNAVPVRLECILPEPKNIDSFARDLSERLTKHATPTEARLKIDQEFAEFLNFVAQVIGRNLSRRPDKNHAQ